MKLGIDFGTNRTVVAAADRGNYPLVSFEGPDGSTADWFPSLVAVEGGSSGKCLYGWEAWHAQANPDYIVVRSLKRLLDQAGPGTQLDLGGQSRPLFALLQGFAGALTQALRRNSNLELAEGEALEAMLGIPAHANSNARFLTAEAFREAGIQVLGILNEPSAASIEFGHRQRQSKGGRETILVYDLGGGTFDASLVTMDERVHHVLATDGIGALGGDDFDQALAELALEKASLQGKAADSLSAAEWFRLLDECRSKKEGLNPNSRRMFIELSLVRPNWPSVEVPVADLYERIRPLVEETVAVAEELLNQIASEQFEALYITGGASELPLVARVLRERFGRRVRRSAYTRSATAIGLAIQAGQPGTYHLSEQLNRYFGVWREAENGRRIVFDPLFEKGASLPATGQEPLARSRSYQPAHNVGHFRYLECSHRREDGTPTGDTSFWDEVRFPFDAALQGQDLTGVAVESRDVASAPWIEERYECDAAGIISVLLTNCNSGYAKRFELGAWSSASKSVQPIRRARAAGA